MRTAKLLLSALALALITLLTEPASAADGNSSSAAIEAMRGPELVHNEARSQVALAGMVAFLTALLVLRRKAQTS